jgi:hypothetical protein
MKLIMKHFIGGCAVILIGTGILLHVHKRNGSLATGILLWYKTLKVLWRQRTPLHKAFTTTRQ